VVIGLTAQFRRTPSCTVAIRALMVVWCVLWACLLPGRAQGMGKNQHSKDKLFLTATECVPTAPVTHRRCHSECCRVVDATPCSPLDSNA
jgi:hypothetical protein